MSNNSTNGVSKEQIDAAKNIQIIDVLNSKNYSMQMNCGHYGFYENPFIEGQRTSSFSVHYGRNRATDFAGNGREMDVIALIMLLDKMTFPEAVKWLLDFGNVYVPTEPIEQKPNKEVSEGQGLLIRKVVDVIKHGGLIDYIKSRGIRIETAHSFGLKEIYYRVYNKKTKEYVPTNNGKDYSALGIENSGGGYALRSKYFKGCTSQGITFIKRCKNPKGLLVFEGIFDAMSYFEFIWNTKQTNIISHFHIIIGSVVNLDAMILHSYQYQKVHLFFDYDKAGERVAKVFDFIRNNYDIMTYSNLMKSHFFSKSYIFINFQNESDFFDSWASAIFGHKALEKMYELRWQQPNFSTKNNCRYYEKVDFYKYTTHEDDLSEVKDLNDLWRVLEKRIVKK